MSETRVLLANIDEPDLHTIDVYERLGGYGSLRKALLEMTPETVLHELEESGLRGRGGAGFSMGKKASFLPKGAMDKYLCCNADESEPGAFKDRLLMQKNPHLLVEGCIIGSIAAGANKGFIFIRGEYELQADILDAAVAEAYEKGYLGDGHPRLRALLRPGGAPRPGRVHLRRGDRPARRARGQARQPAPEAAVPGQPGPLPGPDADQQRRDALQRADHHRARRRLVQAVRRGQLDRHEARLRLRQRPAPGQLRGRARHPGPRDHLRTRRRPARGPRAQVLLPRRLVGARAHAGAPRPALHLRGDGRGRLDAGHGVDHRGRRLASRSCRWRCGSPSSTGTSRAASACRAARARTGP